MRNRILRCVSPAHVVAELLCAGLLCAGISAQTVQAQAAGDLRLLWVDLHGVVHTATAPVNNASTNLNVPQVGDVTFTLGQRTELQVGALPPPGPGRNGSSAASGTVVVSYSATAPVAGILRLTTAPDCVVGPVTFDVGSDGSLEMETYVAQTVDVPVVLGATPLPIRIHSQTVNFGVAACGYVTSIEFLPQPSQLVSLGGACGPGTTAALTTQASGDRNVSLRVSNATGAVGLFAVGFAPGAWPFACPLHTDLVVVVPASPTGGAAQLELPVVAAAVGVYRIQFIEADLSPLAFRTSNGVEVTL